VNGLKPQKEKRSIDHFAGLNISVKATSVCIVDETGKIVREVKVASEPEALLLALKNPCYNFKTSSGLAWKPVHCRRNGCSALSPKPSYRLMCRDAAHEGGVEGSHQQDGPQRRTRHCANDANGTLSPGACEDVTQSETANPADPPQAFAVEGDCR
jgi:hypothetical protein